MAEDDPDRDDEWFNEVYGKEYTGPLSRARQAQEPERKKPAAAQVETSDEEEEGPRDPNAVPTDFTSREAKVWEAKAKAIERNWKRRKEEELHCKICGEAGHFAQGCPTTLGGSRKSGEIVERVALKDKRIKPRLIGTGGSVIQGIEKDTGCRLKLVDNQGDGHGVFFVRVSGPDRLAVSKAVTAVKKVTEQFDSEWSQNSRGRNAKGSNSLAGGQLEHVQRLQQHPSNGGALQAEDLEWGNLQVQVQVQGRSAKAPRDEYFRSRSLENGPYCSARLYEQEVKSPETLDELEQCFLQEAMELSKEQSAEEDRELARHRECLRGIQEQYQQKMMNLRTKQSRRRDEFLHHEIHIRQQYYQQSPAGYLPDGAQCGGGGGYASYGYDYPPPPTQHRKAVTQRAFDYATAASYGRARGICKRKVTAFDD
ncbi:uncharacterized protein LOC9635233 [Selaginella moellendorffii]|uniref:uncharacterized protein LOC9635233 n=1 Tax=Selaginella moellendorffii TaxID=88036 RepID=UPI000D1C6BE4|nr:uncharacterized protein LOC9635233 [Selaginella moellendorffii]XP_024542952.1 uncharacterized protein LOC9635233 [Selaginella moellendorffii]|eukprot:XP_024542951.1 uncharacterized protein LOC9635233 [Selaginella moellendorffii]